MKRVQLHLPVYLPEGVYWRLRKVRDARKGSIAAAGLAGDREVEYTFIAGALPHGPGKAMDFGCGPGFLSLLAAQRGFHVLSLDLEPQQFLWAHPLVEFRTADILQVALPENYFDVIVNCSAVEHVGLAARYSVAEANANADGDLHAMGRMRALLKPGGRMLLTIPCGRDSVFAPLHRVYGAERLPRLLEGFEVARQEYWKKDADNRWVLVNREEALSFMPTADYQHVIRCRYALGCFVLVRPIAVQSQGSGG